MGIGVQIFEVLLYLSTKKKKGAGDTARIPRLVPTIDDGIHQNRLSQDVGCTMTDY